MRSVSSHLATTIPSKLTVVMFIQRNILINEHGEACLTDFGLAGFIESDTTNRAASTRGGSIRWMPPELLVVAPGTHFRRSFASDIWAFGCICGEVRFLAFSLKHSLRWAIADLF